MSDFLKKYREKLLNYWRGIDKSQKIKLVLIVVLLAASLVLFTVLATRTKYQLTFYDLDPKAAGNVVQKLDEMGVSYQLSAGGSNISVPEAEADKVKITMAQEDLGSGQIFSKFWESASLGMTDNQFKVLERGAIEEELRGLVVGIEGISDAIVMITLPKEKVFYSEDQQKATASVVLNIVPGINLTSNQVNGIYNLISKSVPDLPVENITLSDQYGNAFEYLKQDGDHVNYYTYNQQRQIQQEFQQDIKKELDNMLKRLTGPNKVSVSVFAKMNFDQKRTVENLKQPVVDDEGIARSVEQIQESFSGGVTPGGITGTGETQIPGYASESDNNGSYEHIEKRINYDVNEITKEVISSPYRLEDLSIIVAVDLPEDNDPNSQTEKTKQAIRDLIKPVVMAALDDQNINLEDKIAIVAHKFEETPSVFEDSGSIDPMLLYGAVGLSVLALGGLGYGLIRRKKRNSDQDLDDLTTENKSPEFDFSPALTEETALLKEIQKMSKHKPNEFVKLIRTWLSDD